MYGNKRKILNGYSGIGGNRKLWKDVEVTAIEQNSEIAKVYHDLFPNDKIIVGDAHEYLLTHFREFDFIWMSPPCPSHSCIRKIGAKSPRSDGRIQNDTIYPDMSLYQEIILLQHFAFPEKTKWVVENVMPYYHPLIHGKKMGHHYLWSNYPINEKSFPRDRINEDFMKFKKIMNVDLSNYSFTSNQKRAIYRNCVNPNIGKFIFDSAFSLKQQILI